MNYLKKNTFMSNQEQIVSQKSSEYSIMNIHCSYGNTVVLVFVNTTRN